MKNLTVVYYSLLILIIFLGGCEKDIRIDTKYLQRKYIVEGNITNEAGPYRVVISQTQHYNESTEDTLYVSGAFVTIYDSRIIDTLVEVSPGTYHTQRLIGVEGSTYNLTVKIGDNTFTSTATMPYMNHIDSVYADDTTQYYNNTYTGREDTIYEKSVKIIFYNPLKEEDYRFRFFMNDTLYNKEYQIFETDTIFKSVYLLSYKYNGFSQLDLKGKVRINLDSYKHYPNDYIHSFRYYVRNGTNISGGALGYFNAYATSKVEMIIN